MSHPRSRTLATQAAIYAAAVTEEKAAAHQNIADDVADLIVTSLFNWATMLRAPIDHDPDLNDLFVKIADALADAFEGISSAHLQALFAARELCH